MRLHVSRVALLVGACSLVSGFGVAAEKTAAGAVPKVEFEKYTLPNGLQVILHVDRKLPMVHVNQWFHVGSRNERVGRSGFAHLFEHMMFEGSKNAKEKYFSYAEKAGANIFEGSVNGTTDWDCTIYWTTVPSGNLQHLLWLESDRLATLGEALDQARLDNQRDVVRNERRWGFEDVPYGRWMKLVSENLYPFHHPYANDVIGSHEDLAAATLADVKDFFETYYTPNNLSMVIAGDFDPAEAKRLVEKYFASIPAGPALDRPPRSTARLEGEVVVEAKDRVPQERTYLAWHSPAFFDPGDAELDLLATMLTDGLSARLNKALVYDRQLCSDVSSLQLNHEAAGAFIVWATARPGVALGEVEKVVDQEIARLAREGPTTAELNRARAKWEFNFVSGLETIGFFGKANRLNWYATFLGDPDRFEADVARHRSATVESVRQATAKWLDTHNRVVLRFHPETSVRESTAAVDRSVQPPLGADRPFLAPPVEAATLPNGLEVLVVKRPELPKVAVSFVTRIGGIYDPPEKAGVAGLMTNTIRRGTKTRGALEIEQALGDLGTSVSGFADRERSGLAFEVLKHNLDAALAIVSDVVQNPSFPESEVEREKKLRLDGLAQESQDTYALAFRIGQILAFGPDHPYGRVEVPASVQRITREDLAQFHGTYWKPGVSALVFVGDVTLAEATELARTHLGSWSGVAPMPMAVPEARPPGPGKVYLVDRQDAAQTQMMGILPGPSRTAPDYQALRLADTVFGNGITTRLNLNLREEKGYTYGALSFPTVYSRAGAWRIFSAVQTAKTKESVAELVKETRFIAGEKPVSESELAFAKSLRVRSYAQQFESVARIGGQVAELWSLSLPMTELQKEPAEIEGTTLAAVNAAAQKFGALPGLTLLLVGDLAKIEPGVRELNLGEIVVLDVEGQPIVSK